MGRGEPDLAADACVREVPGAPLPGDRLRMHAELPGDLVLGVDDGQVGDGLGHHHVSGVGAISRARV